MIKLRYAKGSGRAPVHLAAINAADAESGDLVFSGMADGQYRVPFTSRADLLRLLETLMAMRVPFAVGGMCPGPADEVALLIDNKQLVGSFVELSWSGPEQWILRETANAAGESSTEFDPGLIAEMAFDPATLKLCI